MYGGLCPPRLKRWATPILKNKKEEERMKLFRKMAGVVALVGVYMVLGTVNPVFAKTGDKSVNVGLNFGSEPVSGFGSTTGFSIGGGYEIEDNMQIRGDISFFSWEQSAGGIDLKYARTPITISGRQYLPLQEGLRAYGQFGVEYSLDTVEVAINWFGTTTKAEASENHFGITPGAGIEYAITPQISVGAEAMYHIITDPYFTLGINAGYHF